MPEFHAEPYIYLPAVTHKSALVAWGAFYFRTTSSGKWKIVDDHDLKYVHPPRKDSIGAQSAPYGPARVEVYDKAGALVSVAKTEVANHCWLPGLKPDTEYVYKVFVKDEEWAVGERWDWSAKDKALVQAGNSYDNRFCTNPGSDCAGRVAQLRGDRRFRRRREEGLADAPPAESRERACARAVDTDDVRLILTTGDNIYAGTRLLGIPIGGSGDEDDDWFFTYFQPYRYVINRVPVFPSIGNHDADETEERDDRAQVEDNFYLRERLAGGEEAAGPRVVLPRVCSIGFATAPTSSSSASTRRRKASSAATGCSSIPSTGSSSRRRFRTTGAALWRIPFCHHPPYCAGPQHHNTKGMQRLIPLFERSGVKVMFSGHEHNFQHSRGRRHPLLHHRRRRKAAAHAAGSASSRRTR